MRTFSVLIATVCLLLSGCESKPVPMGGPVTVSSGSAPVAAVASDLTFMLSPENTRIEFVGTHTGDKPDPRKGRFEKFTGKLQADVATKTLSSVSLEIDTSSLATDIEKLTNHLKSSDFFDVRTHPTASFESTKIESAAEGEGQIVITGNLTLLGVTKEITVPATIDLAAGPKLRSDFTINRSEFGMNFSPDMIDDKVSLTVVMGEQTPASEP